MNRTLLSALTAVALCHPPACLAGAGVYSFADAQGVVYLSNIPDDERYLLLEPGAAAAPAAAAVALEPNGPGAPIQPPLAFERVRAYDGVVENAGREFGLEPALLHAVIAQESGYNARVVSRRGAAGLMQLMPATALRFGVADAFDPVQNVRAGAQYLSGLLKRFDGNLELALAAYNAGEGAVLRYGRSVPPFPETLAYVPRVVAFYRQLLAAQ